MNDWQSIAALSIVIVTATIFVCRAVRKKKPGCGGGCGCAMKPHK